MAEQREYDVFICYADEDRQEADNLVSYLEDKGLRCWYAPRDVLAGDVWAKSLGKTIKSTAVFLLILSEAANCSERVLYELALAHGCEGKIVAFQTDSAAASDSLRRYLAGQRWIINRQYSALYAAIYKLLWADEEYRPQPKPTPPLPAPISALLGFLELALSPQHLVILRPQPASPPDQPQPAPPPEPSETEIEFSAIAPKTLTRGDYSIINVLMYEKDFRQMVEQMKQELGENVQEARSGVHRVRLGANIQIVLRSPELTVEEDTESGVWQGGHLTFSFPVLLPEDYSRRQVLFVASVYVDGVIFTRLKFVARCVSDAPQRLTVAQKPVRSVFLSYSTLDRPTVVRMAEAMQSVRQELDIFLDVDSLRRGDEWEQRIDEEIARRDVLYLCWSKNASQSKWVDHEWRYALQEKGLGGIEPLPLERPDNCPPPAELSSKNFNDRLLFYT